MKVLITGATGLVGQEIVKCCHEQGNKVHYLTTRKSKIEHKDNYKGFYWNLDTNEIDLTCFNDVNAIIHLAGASIAKRWTPSYKETIIKSRIDSAKLLFDSLKKHPNQVEHFISASAIGIYPDSLTNYYKEDHSKVNSSFLGNVVKAWESAADAFNEINIEVSKVRIGLVLDANEGAFPQLIKPIKFGLGAPLGKGNQWQSWIHVEDLAGIFTHVLEKGLVGVFNAVAPSPATNKELTQLAAKQLKLPLFLPNVPKFVMKLLLGEMHILLFESQRVSSNKIEQRGYAFKYYNLKNAIANLLG